MGMFFDVDIEERGSQESNATSENACRIGAVISRTYRQCL